MINVFLCVGDKVTSPHQSFIQITADFWHYLLSESQRVPRLEHSEICFYRISGTGRRRQNVRESVTSFVCRATGPEDTQVPCPREAGCWVAGGEVGGRRGDNVPTPPGPRHFPRLSPAQGPSGLRPLAARERSEAGKQGEAPDAGRRGRRARPVCVRRPCGCTSVCRVFAGPRLCSGMGPRHVHV